MMRFKTGSRCKVLQWGRGPVLFWKKTPRSLLQCTFPGKLVLPIIKFLADNIIPV